MQNRIAWFIVLIILVGLTGPTVGLAQEDDPGIFEEADCFFDVPPGVVEGEDVICGYVTVPEDYADPTGPVIQIAVVIVKDNSPNHQPDPVMLLAGGPGEKAVTNAPVLAQVLATLARDRDLVLFDQRGVGQSEPALECPEFVETAFDLLDEPAADVVLKTTFEAIMACRDRLAADGVNFDAYNTQQNAADVNAIRLALGYDQVNLYGGSYGTLLAQATMRDYPAGIRSVVIDSVLPLEKSLVLEVSITATRSILRLFESCAADPACNAAYPDLQNVFLEVVDRLNADPVPVTLTNPLNGQPVDALLTGDAVRVNLFTFLYDTAAIPVLPQAIFDVYNGDYALMTQLSSLRLGRYGALTLGMELSVMCTDDLIGYTPDDLFAIRDQLPVQLLDESDIDEEAITAYSWFGICENWPVTEADPSVRDPLTSDIPTLALAGEFDPVTPPEYGALVADHLDHAYFFELPGVGHSVLVANACAQEIAADFLRDPSTAPDARCIDDLPGVVFDLPVESGEIVMEPFTSIEQAFSTVAPVGWAEVGPAYFARQTTGIDQTQIVTDAAPISKAEFLAILAGQLRFDPAVEPAQTGVELGNFTWDLYELNLRGYRFDLALTEDDSRAYFTLLISSPDERDELYETVFLPTLGAMESTQAPDLGALHEQ